MYYRSSFATSTPSALGPRPILRSYQVSVEELLWLQVFHGFTDILAHLQQLLSLEAVAHLPQVVQEAAIGHVLSDDEDGALFSADAVQLHQFLMGQIPTGKAVNQSSLSGSEYYSERSWGGKELAWE